MGDGFYRSKDPTNSIKVLKEKLQKKITQRTKKTQNTHAYTQNGKTNTAYKYNTTSPLVYNNMGWLGDSSHRGQWMAVGLPIGKPWHKVTARVQKQLTKPCYSQWSLIWGFLTDLEIGVSLSPVQFTTFIAQDWYWTEFKRLLKTHLFRVADMQHIINYVDSALFTD